MKTIGYVLVLLVLVIVARIVGGAAGRVSAEGNANHPSTEMVNFLGELKRFQIDSANRATAANNAYMNALKAGGWNSLFDANRIQNDTGLADSFEIVIKAKAAFERYKIQVVASVEASKEQIKSLNISDSEKKAMLSSFAIGSIRNDEILVLEGQAMSESGEVISLLSSNRNWSVENGGVIFNDNALQTAVNSHFQNIGEISHKQQNIREELLRSVGIK